MKTRTKTQAQVYMKLPKKRTRVVNTEHKGDKVLLCFSGDKLWSMYELHSCVCLVCCCLFLESHIVQAGLELDIC